jgi:hypothetical protein
MAAGCPPWRAPARTGFETFRAHLPLALPSTYWDREHGAAVPAAVGFPAGTSQIIHNPSRSRLRLPRLSIVLSEVGPRGNTAQHPTATSEASYRSHKVTP